MAVQRDTEVDAVTLMCDGCGDLLSSDFSSADFQGMIAYAKDHGWTVKPDGEGGFEHRCPSCPPESRLEAARRRLGL